MVGVTDKRELAKGYLKVPTAILGVFIFMSAQTFGAVWWASSLTTKIDFLQETQRELKKMAETNGHNRYTSTDANVDKADIYIKIMHLEENFKELDKRVTSFQSKHETVLENLIKNKRR